MKKQIRTLLLLAALASYGLPTLAQSTQGTDFWVSSTIVCSPDKKTAEPYIAVSAEEACTITIKGGENNAINIVQQVTAGSWNEFGNSAGNSSGRKPYNTNPATGAINVQMDASKWYPVNLKDANQLSTMSNVTRDYGLHITSSDGKKISVYVILSSPYSMDASNILPVTALGDEYYTQDYWADERDGDFPDVLGITTILSTQNNTRIRISPKGTTYAGNSSPYEITLQQGQVYYLATQKKGQLAGTHIESLDGNPIAVFCGVPITNLPSGLAARDCLFDQAMPTKYLGTQFIATRSLEKDGNLIGITAVNPNGADISVDGYYQASISQGDTYYIMLQGAANPHGKNPGNRSVDMVITADAAYIETSCPCAVYNYDTGNGYKGNSGSEIIEDKHGDPSSVCLSPIQQKINKITFGTCYTNDTKDHFLNVVTETATCQNTTLTALNGATTLDKTNLLSWTPVPGNTAYSYARAKIGDENTSQYSVFRLENAKGFIATVYGNGKNESYAYSAGSAAVERGVYVSREDDEEMNETFTKGYRSDKKFCLDANMIFDARGTGSEITRVEWEFGDGTGTSWYEGMPPTGHTYTTYGWKDVTAVLYGRQACTDEDTKCLDTIMFSFIIAHPDTFINQPEHHCITIDGKLSDGTQLTEERIAYLIEHGDNDTTQADCASDVYITPVSYGRDIEEQLDTIFGFNIVNDRNGDPHSISKDIVDTIPASGKNCMRIQKYRVEVIACLDMEITQPQSVCLSEKMKIDYQKYKGEILSARFVVPSEGIDEEVAIDNDWVELSLPTDSIKTPGYYNGELIVRPWIPEKYKEQLIAQGEHCDSLVFPINITVNYPSDIFEFKFNNVLAVYKPGFGGNTDYQFSHYEWHLVRNAQDTLLAEGEDLSVFYLGQGIPFEEGDVVYVVLTDDSGMKLSSCPQTLRDIQKDYSTQSKPTPAQKKIVNRQFVIIRGDDMFDIYGQRVK